MREFASVALSAVLLGTTARAQVPSFPANFKTRTISTPGAQIFVRVGGQGPAVVLLHGYGETGDMWAPLAAGLARGHTVIVPDLRGMGLSSHPAGGYDKKTQAGDVAAVLDTLKIDKVDLVTHDIGNMVGYAFAAGQPGRVTKFALLDAPLPGVGPWDEILKNPLLWHFRFGGPDMERLVKGRERIYLDRFWNEFSADPRRFDEASRRHYARLYALPGAMHGQGHAGHACAGGGRRGIVRPDDGGGHARCRQQRPGGRHSPLRALVDGGESDRHGFNHRGLPPLSRLNVALGMDDQHVAPGGRPIDQGRLDPPDRLELVPLISQQLLPLTRPV